MENTVKERIKIFLKFKKISQKDFSESVGLSSGYLGAMKKSFSTETINNIVIRYPDINIDWLLTGKGEMIKEDIGKSGFNSEIGDYIYSTNPLNSDDMKNLITQMTGIISRQEDNISQLISELSKNGTRADRMINLMEHERGITYQGDSVKKTGSD